MAKIIDGITFNNLSRIGKGSPFGNVRNPDITSESDLQDYIDAGEEYRNIQSVLIDWNGAKPGIGEGANGINTTGELLSLLKNYAAIIPLNIRDNKNNHKPKTSRCKGES